jgi:hypothetical protein
MRSRNILGVLPMLSLGFYAFAARGQTPPPGRPWDEVDAILRQSGKSLPGGVRRYGWPRTDHSVTVGAVPIEPALALGSWAAFCETGEGDEAIAMGDLVLLGPEVNPVVAELELGGIEVLAIHNHLLGETPRLLYVHFHGRAPRVSLARSLASAFAKTQTPFAVAPKSPAGPTPRETETFETVQRVLGRKGSLAGRVLQVSLPRAGRIEDGGMELPPAMGMAIAINFQPAAGAVATTDDFVLIADEVNPVIREVQSHGLEVTALHCHMLREEPRLFFVHFWGVGAPEPIAAGLKAALAKVAAP